MNEQMQRYSKKLTMKFVATVSIFAVMASLMVGLIRYEQSLKRLKKAHEGIVSRITQMKAVEAETRRTVDRIKQSIPPGYGTRTDEWLIYSKMDSIRATLQPTEMNLSTIEEKEGFKSLQFTYKPKDTDYSRLLNQTGLLETSVYPLVSIDSIKLGRGEKGSEKSESILVEGTVKIPVNTAASGEVATKK